VWINWRPLRTIAEGLLDALRPLKSCQMLYEIRDGTGRGFRDPTRPITCLLNRPVTSGLTGENNCQILTALDRPVDWQKLQTFRSDFVTQNKLDGCIARNVNNTVLGSKRLPICACHLTQCHLRWGLPPYQVAFCSIQPFGHNKHRLKFRRCCAPYGKLGSHLTQCGLGRHVPP